MAEFRPFDREGAWDLEALEKLEASDWHGWLDARLHGRDRLAPCDPDEHPADLFIGLIEKDPHRVRHWAALAEAATRVLEAMDPLAEDELAVSGAIEIVAHMHSPLAADCVCDWIDREVFIRGRPLPRLHSALLYALACMQEQGKPLQHQLLVRYLRDAPTDETGRRYPFMVPAFAGLAMGSRELPGAELVAFLRRVLEAEKHVGRPINIAPAALALFVERESPETVEDIWDITTKEADASTLWERLRQALAHTRHVLPERVSEPLVKTGAWRVPMWTMEAAG
ncbi:MAG: hypothetical protein FJ291_14100 [Planctomycetes bacterium]|nr:hypothetical protein [Planctomycetota bacterium]